MHIVWIESHHALNLEVTGPKVVVEDEVVCATAEEEYPALAGIPMDKWSAPRLLGVWADEE